MRKTWMFAASTTLVVMSFSMYNPVLAVLLQERGYSIAAIGAFAMIPFACVALLIPFMPRVFKRFGIGRCYLAGLLLEALCTLGYLAFDNFWLWCGSSVLGGMGAAAVWNATEALLAQNAPADRRGHVMGLYQTALGGALAAGPFIPAVLLWSAQTTLWAAAVAQLAALTLVLTMMLGARTVFQRTPVGVTDAGASKALGTWGAMCSVPALVGIAFVGGVFEAGLGSVSAAYGASLGLSMAAAASIVGVLGMGSFVFQYPAGLAADRFAVKAVFTCAGAALLVASLAFAWADAHWWVLWAAALLWGGVGGALYTLTMVQAAHYFSVASMAAGAAGMITGYTLGGAVGPVVSGAALQYFGNMGLSAWLSGLSVAVILLSRKLV